MSTMATPCGSEVDAVPPQTGYGLHVLRGSAVLLLASSPFMRASPMLAAYREAVVIGVLSLLLWPVVPIAAWQHPGKTPLRKSALAEPADPQAPEDTADCAHNRIQAAAEAGDVLEADAEMVRALKAGETVDAGDYETLITALSKAGRIEAAEAWLEYFIEAGLGGPSRSCIHAVISGCAERGLLAVAELWFRKMVQFDMDANLESFNVMLDACARCEDPHRAGAWLEEMKDAGIQADAASYRSVISACIQAGDADRAEAWLSDMSDSGIQPDPACYGAVFRACAAGNDPQRADAAISRMIDEGNEPDAASYDAMISVCAQGGDAESAESWLDRMLRMDVQPSEDTLREVLQAVTDLGDAARLDAFRSRMEVAGPPCSSSFLETAVPATSPEEPGPASA